MTESAECVFHAYPGRPLTGRWRVPGDKSISHRSIMLGALADGETRIDGFLEGEDALATLRAFRALGVTIEGPEAGRVLVRGVGLHGLRVPSAPLDVGNSGTSMRLMAGLLAAQRFDSVLVGDASLSRRPMDRVAAPLRRMGAVIETEPDGRPPLRLHGGQPLQGITYTLPMASAQVKSCLLLAGLYASGTTTVIEPAPTRDHTERMLRGFGYDAPLTVDGRRVSVTGGGALHGCRVDVPADISSAAFFLVAATLVPGSDLVLEHVGVNPTRTGVIDILRLMGADLTLEREREVGGEPVADIRVRHAPLHGVDIPPELVPLAIDEFPVLFVAASQADGETRLSDAGELRVKESDRIQVMADNLSALGVQATARPDGMVIQGGPLRGGTVHARGDHRVAMALTVAGQCADAPVVIHDCRPVATSFPGFEALAVEAGLGLRVDAGAAA